MSSKIYKTIATAPGQPDIVVELTEAEYADYYERLNNPSKPTLAGANLADFLRGLFKPMPLSYRVGILRNVYPILDILERDPSITETEYLEFVDLLKLAVQDSMTEADIQGILTAVEQYIAGFDFKTV